MTRPAEVAHQTGTEAEFEDYVRVNFPQCIARDEEGNELVPVQYQSAYDHVTGIHYIDQLVLEPGVYDQDGNEITPPLLGGKALMVEFHVPPASIEQEARIATRVLLSQIAEDPQTLARNRARALNGLRNLRRTVAAPGVEARTPTTIGWAGEPGEPTQTARDAVDKIVNGTGKAKASP